MAHLLPAATIGAGPPAELLDPQHPVWTDAGLFARWADLHGLDAPAGDTWAERFERGRDAWARANGITTTTAGRSVDHDRLRDLGVPHVGALARVQARAGAIPIGVARAQFLIVTK